MAIGNLVSVSAADANRSFSELLRGVRDGNGYVVTSHGKPVAKLIPFDGDPTSADAARRTLLARLRKQPVVDIGPWTRDSLYEDPA
ncbi:MAG: type II toxin-antitoxin system prevent-host-death family antitoxin [Acidobacteria bacterium]|nr:type II toxin-antitoxin system prevent-host-death family antitoxin [Acidobacteriota bacterium]